LLTYLLYGLFILSCLILVVSVLLQPGKADAGALFSSGVSSTAFGPRGTQTLLAKITIGAAAAFMLLALALSIPRLTQSRSVVEAVGETTATPTPAASPQASPQAQGSPAAEQKQDQQATPAEQPQEQKK
jgi:preprotein translocase subunit SecG